jgi:hypothetical protein
MAEHEDGDIDAEMRKIQREISGKLLVGIKQRLGKHIAEQEEERALQSEMQNGPLIAACNEMIWKVWAPTGSRVAPRLHQSREGQSTYVCASGDRNGALDHAAGYVPREARRAGSEVRTGERANCKKAACRK